MPRTKNNRGRVKNISCPRCGKKFCSETNVLQHMNQPTGLCYTANWYEENFGQLRSQSLVQDPLHDLDWDMAPPDASADDDYRDPPFLPTPSFDNSGQEGFADQPGEIEMEVDASAIDQPTFTETYPGCGKTYPGGSTFLDSFWKDDYSKERRANLYYPFSSSEEWEFSSWCVRSGLSMTAIQSLLSLKITRRLSLSFRTAKDLRARVESLPPGPQWMCRLIKPDYPMKRPIRLFYRPALECLQSLLSHPLLAPHISFVPRKIWTSAARICRVYEDWLSGDRAWAIQDALPDGATTLGVILSSDKTNISVMSGNRMAYPLLISLANIAPDVRSKISMHTYLLLALLPVAKFPHKDSRVRGLMHDRIIHHSLNIILEPVKTAAHVGIMMDDPVGNLRYCFTPLAAYIADTPELSLLACTNPKASPFTVAISRNFGDSFLHDPRTGLITLAAIRQALEKSSAEDYKAFLKVCRSLQLNGVVEPCWLDWPLSCPSEFLHIEPLHHFFRFSWDHDVHWCIEVVTPSEIDYRFSLIRPMVGYRGFEDGLSKLKQVTGRDHRSVQRYIIGVIAGAVPRRFLIAVRTVLVEFRYLAQAPAFSDRSLEKLSHTLQLFHDNKDSIIRAGVRKVWEIPKLELLQSVVSNIRRSGPVTQWSADATEHAHVQEVKVPARLSNNQNYYDQIARYLDRSDKCFRFDIATYFESRREGKPSGDDDEEEEEEEHNSDLESDSHNLRDNMRLPRAPVNYFVIANALASGSIPRALTPHRTFSTSTTAFHLATKPSLRTTVDEAAILFGLPDLRPAIAEFLQRIQRHSDHPISATTTQDDCPLPFDRIQVWYKFRLQQYLYHKEQVDAPQTLRAIPPSDDHPHGIYDTIIISSGPESDWPRRGIEGHMVGQIRLVFRPLNTDYFATYVQGFNIVTQTGEPSNIHPVVGMNLLRRATKTGGARIGSVIPMSHIRSPAHMVPSFGKEAHARLTRESSCELLSDFWLNKYWSKEFYYALSL